MIQIIKMSTGEELIGEVELSGDYIIKQPCVLQMVMSRTDPNTPAMSLIPYAFYVEGHTIRIPAHNIIWLAKPIDELYNQYNRIFGSGIQLASAGI